MSLDPNNRTKILVTSNKSSGPNTLAAAIQQTQQQFIPGAGLETAYYDIVFQIPPKKEQVNGAGLAYFTIEMDDSNVKNGGSLNIFRNDIRINAINSHAVTLIPKNASASPTLKPTPFAANAPNWGASGSMLTVGDRDHIYNEALAWKGEKPKVHLNFINFSKNISRGGTTPLVKAESPSSDLGTKKKDSSDQYAGGGGGGGLGVGGGITLIDGDLKITNSIFQNLSAEGGKGTPPASGGYPHWDSGFQFHSYGPGAPGTAGAPPSLRDNMAANDCNTVAAGGYGGAGSPATGASNDGGDASAVVKTKGLGYGGGGGGGGAGGDEYQAGAYGGRGASGFAGGGDGTDGCAGPGDEGDKSSGQPGCALRPPWSQDGWAIGGSIAIIGQYINNRLNNGEAVLTPELTLDNVSIYGDNFDAKSKINTCGNFTKGSTCRGDMIYGDDKSILSPNKRTPIYVNELNNLLAPGEQKGDTNIVFGSGPDDIKKKNYRNINVNLDKPSAIQGQYLDAEFVETPKPPTPSSKDQNTAKFHRGLSQPIVPNVVEAQGSQLYSTPNMADKFIINYDKNDGNVGITTDLTDPNNPLNQLFHQAVPDKTQEIQNEYNSKRNTAWYDVLFSGSDMTSTSSPMQNGIAFYDFTSKLISKGKAGALGIGAMAGFSVYNYFTHQSQLKSEENRSLQENEKTQQALNDELQKGSTTAIASIDITQRQSMPTINNFEIGVDTIFIPKTEPNQERTEKLAFKVVSNTFNPGNKAVEVAYEVEGGKTNAILQINFDDKSSNYFGTIDAADPTELMDYAKRVSPSTEGADGTKSGGSFYIGTSRQSAQIVPDDPNVINPPKYIPLGTSIKVDRRVNTNDQIPLTTPIPIVTFTGSDYIYGSNGIETIKTNENHDIILPVLGNNFGEMPMQPGIVDTIDGGEGSDLVNYLLLEDSIHVSVDPTGNKLEVYNSNNDDQIGLLQNIENIKMFGASNLDLTGLVDESLNPDSKDNSQTSNFTVFSGSGGSLTGSTYDDKFILSYDPSFNQENSAPYGLTTTIDGGDGQNSAYFDFSDAPSNVTPILNKEDGGYSWTMTDPGFNNQVLVKSINITTYDWVSKDGVDHKGDDPIIDMDSPKISSKKISSRVSLSNGDNRFMSLDGDDNISGLNGDDHIQSRKGNDILHGGEGKDILKGGHGKDLLVGGSGSDHIYSGKGRDILIGGLGNDHYILAKDNKSNLIIAESGRDKVENFKPNANNKIYFPDILIPTISRIKRSANPEEALKTTANNIVFHKNKIHYQNDSSGEVHTIKFIDISTNLDASSILSKEDYSNRYDALLIGNHLLSATT